MDVTVAERSFTIEPVRVKDLPQFLAALEPVAREVAAGDVLSAVAKHTSGMIEATAIGSGADRAWLQEQTPDVLVELAAAVIEVNADFFVQRVLPAALDAVERIVRIASGGTSGLPGSSPQDSTTRA